MKPIPIDGEAQPRMSTDSKRSFSFGLGKKRSSDLESQQEKPSGRRFSLLPQSLSLKGLMGGREHSEPNTPQMQEQSWHGSRPPTGQTYPAQSMSSHDGQQDAGRPLKYNNFSRPPQTQYRPPPPSSQPNYDVYGGTGVYNAPDMHTQPRQGVSQPTNQFTPHYPDGFGEQPRPSMQQSRHGRAVLTKTNRKFNEAYEGESGPHSGSSGAVRKVQDFFRRRGRARADSDNRY
jgi:protein-serine/threonine kinase